MFSRFFILTTAFILPSLFSIGQDAEMEAIALYTKAETMYNDSKYEEALAKIAGAESRLGGPNSKTLYLKINTLYKLEQKTWKYHDSLNGSLKQFFAVTDKETYPRDKYIDIVNISIDEKEKQEKYDDDFAQIQKTNDLTEMESFLNQYPQSSHSSELQKVYTKLTGNPYVWDVGIGTSESSNNANTSRKQEYNIGDINNTDIPITMLGIDFTQATFSGEDFSSKTIKITNEMIQNSYVPIWNSEVTIDHIFVAKGADHNFHWALHRDSKNVEYFLEPTQKANSHQQNPNYLSAVKKKWDESVINTLVRKYNFGNKNGLGLIFFAEGVDVEADVASAWVVYVDMNSKTVLKCFRQDGKLHGKSLQDYWVWGFSSILFRMHG
ncbi:outer membrane protein assembly factor BamD [Taibaiella soli]|uniref:Uncharacterized protein n=1 Tax=Taibaiella soli TaxID=1649169 RepID=A0A2W2AGF0_9BACT|nr:hypothetical protein [Taibaiella soli]PZF72602.1 hypothetical protein DN068_12105 [Taibaiella soli]